MDVAREAAELVARGRATAAEHVDVKSSPVDVVTAVDTASEELVVGRLLAARPDDGVLGEEGAARAGTSGVRWVIDPIDGTVNFLYDLPAYAVSIAAEVDGVVRAGVVLNVATGELFTATPAAVPTCRPRPTGPGAADRQPAGVPRADPGRHRVRLPGGAAPGAGCRRRRGSSPATTAPCARRCSTR